MSKKEVVTELKEHVEIHSYVKLKDVKRLIEFLSIRIPDELYRELQDNLNRLNFIGIKEVTYTMNEILNDDEVRQ